MEATLNRICVIVAVAVCWVLLALVRASDAFRARRQGRGEP
jgi:hypothetical protein